MKQVTTIKSIQIITSFLFAIALISSCQPQVSNSGNPITKKATNQTGQNKDGASYDDSESETGDASDTDDSTQANPKPQISPTPSPTVDPISTCYKGSEFACKVEKLITDMTNEYRAQKGLNPVAHDPKISFVSRDWSQKQISVGMGHSGFPGQRVSTYQKEFGIRMSFSAENVAMSGRVRAGSQSDAEVQALAKEFATMWWNSMGHRMNMLGRNHKLLGVGVASNGRMWYATQIFR
ncbi:MAG: CAP domain-containing protein [Proteobacteria bacterium]|nr:CAP domain-containing protein [Pseudomonadota bacterium]